MNGLTISKEEFRALPSARKEEVIYDNLVYIRKVVTKWRFHLKIQYALISALGAAVLFMFTVVIER